MLNQETLKQINNPPHGLGYPAAAALAAGAVLAAIATLVLLASPALAAGILAAGAAAAVAVYVRGGSPAATPLHYDLDTEAAERFTAVQRACEELANAEKVWVYDTGSAKKNSTPEERAAAEVGVLEMPNVSANVEVWGILAGETRLCFFPDCALYYTGEEYRVIPYPAFKASSGKVEKLEEGEVPEDAEVIDQTWRHLRDDGGPDLRFTSNPKLTTVSYGTLRLSGPRLDLELLVSSRSAAASFARVFSPAPEEPAEEEQPRVHAPPAPPARVSPAHAVLGVNSGASKSEVTAAYRKLARQHHPDTVAGLDPESREASETRMKEINAAYAELRRQA